MCLDWINGLFEMINQDLRPKEQNIKCCWILGSVAVSWRGSKLRFFAHASAFSALLHDGNKAEMFAMYCYVIIDL